MKLTIDRFENDFAIVETEGGQFADLPKILIPQGCEAGSVIYITSDTDETKKRHYEMKQKMNNIFK